MNGPLPPSHPVCPDCGRPLPAGRTGAGCPRCLLGAALEDIDADAGIEAAGIDKGDASADGGPVTTPFEDYELLGEIARGGMGVVWRARQLSLDRVVALKMLRAGALPGEAAARRFRQEAATVARLRHAHIIAIHAIGDSEGRPFYTMELAEGGSLADPGAAPRRSLRNARDIAHLMARVARAVHHAHERGILHRDLKPANILFTRDGEPKVADFGLAKVTGRDSVLTIPGEILGTPSYMSPEQAAGRSGELTTASDVFSLGAILYELLAGRPPFVADTTAALLRQIIEDDPVPLRRPSSRPGTPAGSSAFPTDRDLENICLKCLEKEPGRRYPSALALAEDLERWQRHEAILARPAGTVERALKWARRHPARAALLAASVLALGLFLVQQQRHTIALRRERDAARAAHARAEAIIARQRLVQADQLLAGGKTADALAQWAHALRTDPSNTIAAARVHSVLSHRSFVLPWPGDTHRRPPAILLEFTPDGRSVLTSHQQVTVLRDAITWEVVAGPWPDRVTAVRATWSRDASRVALVGGERAQLWSVAGPRELLPGLPMPQWSVPRFTADESALVVAGGERREIWLQDLRSGAIREWIGDGGPAGRGPSLMGPSGQHLFVTTASLLQAWDPLRNRRGAESPLEHRTRFIHATPGVPLILLEADTEGIEVRDETSLDPVWPRVPVTRPLDLHLVADGTTLVSAKAEQWGQIWDLATGQPVGEPALRSCASARVRFDPDGQRLWLFGDHEGVHLCDARDGRMRSPPLRHQGLIMHAEYSPDGSRVATSSRDGTARVWEADSARPVTPPLSHGVPVRAAHFSRDSRRIATLAADNSARVWDARTGELVAGPLHHAAFQHGVTLDPAGTQLVVFGEGGVRIHDEARRWQGRSLPGVSGRAPQAVFSADGKTLMTLGAAAGQPSRLDLWPAGTDQPRLSFNAETPLVRAALSPDSTRVAVARIDATVQLLDTRTGSPLGRVMKHHDYIWSVAFDPAGQILLTAGTDRTARLWDARTGEPLCEPLLHDSSVWQAQFSRDGRRILTQTKDDVARVWDVASGLPVTEPLPGHPVGLNIIMSPSTPARFSADNRRVILPAGDNTAGWLELPPDEPAPAWLPDLVEAIAGRRWTGRGPETLPWSDLESARSLLPQNSGGNAWTAWAQWLLADRSTRTLSPTSTQHVGEYVADCLDAGTLASLLDAARLQPTNQLVRARLAAHWARDRDPKFPGRPAFFQRATAAPR